jgi:hypothetical protein
VDCNDCTADGLQCVNYNCVCKTRTCLL